MKNHEEDFLKVAMEFNGIAHFRKTITLARWILWLGCITVLLGWAGLAVQYAAYWQNIEVVSWQGLFYKYLYPVAATLSPLAAMLQVYWYYTFLRKGNAAINASDSAQFNQSFRYFYISMGVGLVNILLILFINASSLFIFLKFKPNS